MRNETCAACQAAVPAGQAFAVAGKVLCGKCTEQFIATQPGGRAPAGSITKLVDPTICTKCGADNGSEDLGRIVGAPLCQTCIDFYRNRPYPTWLKWSFVGFVC